MFFSPRSPLAVAATVALILSACGGSDEGSGELNEADLALAAAITADLQADDEDGFGEVFDVTCMGTEMVRGLGGAAAADEKYGFNVDTVSDMDDKPMQQADAEKVVAGYQKCGDFGDLLVASFTAFGASEDEAKCVVDAIPEQMLTDAFVTQLVSPEGGSDETPLDTAIADAGAECGFG